MHDGDYAGISAFANRSSNQWERNALMLAVGALVPLDRGRLGRSWKHADKLKALARYTCRSMVQRHGSNEGQGTGSGPDENAAATRLLGR